VPCTEAQVFGVYLAKGKKEHQEDECRQYRATIMEPFIAYDTYYHREPESVGIKEISHCIVYSIFLLNKNNKNKMKI
jgi:hypothetical protein